RHTAFSLYSPLSLHDALPIFSTTNSFEQDKELIKFYIQCFDRPAFQDDIHQEGRMEDFDKAIEDTLIALNTGVLRTRNGAILKRSEEHTSELQSRFDLVCRLL